MVNSVPPRPAGQFNKSKLGRRAEALINEKHHPKNRYLRDEREGCAVSDYAKVARIHGAMAACAEVTA